MKGSRLDVLLLAKLIIDILLVVAVVIFLCEM